MFYLYVVPPQPPLKYRNLTILLDSPVEINCSVTALPKPDFQWFNDSTSRKPLPQTSWSSNYDDVMGISTLVHTFSRGDLNDDCAILVVCVATNSYGQSEQHFNLTLEDSDKCPSIPATTAIAPSTPAIITVNEQGQGDNGGDSPPKDGEMDEMQGIIIGVAIASAVIVLGVLGILVLLLRNVYTCKK